MKSIAFLIVFFATSSALEEYINSTNLFTASVYKELAGSDEDNFLFSPLSANLILALSQSGAQNETAEEIQNSLNLPNNQELIEEEIKTVLPLFENQDFILHTINKIYVKNNFVIKDEFKDVAKDVFNTSLESINFEEKEEAAETINRWIGEATDYKIKKLIDAELLSNATRAVLINTLRFKANWTVPFQFFDTCVKKFYTSPENSTDVETMHITSEEFEYYEKAELNTTFLVLPLKGDNVSMTIALPNSITGLELLEEHIDEVLEAPDETSYDLFNVAVPKFKLESKIDLKEILKNLGVEKAFEDGEADFSGIAGEKGELFISEVAQNTFMDVTEFGIDASAATFIIKLINRNANTSKDFIVNHPFIFFVKVHDVVVFIGRVKTPSY